MNLIKCFHLFFLFLWIGSLLVLSLGSRHLSSQLSTKQQELGRFYKKIYFYLDLPSMILAIGLGIILLVVKEVELMQGWFHMKLTATVILIICDLFLGKGVCRFNRKPFQKKALRFPLIFACTILFLLMALVSVYIIKPRALRTSEASEFAWQKNSTPL